MNSFDRYILIEARRIFDEYDDETPEALMVEAKRPLPSPMNFEEELDRFKELSAARKACGEQEDYFCSEAFAVEQRIVEQMAAEGYQNFKRNGSTFYLRRQFDAGIKPETKADLVRVMRELGHDEMICVQPQTFAAWAREMLNDEATGNQLPEEVRPLVNVHEVVRLRILKS